MKKVLIGIKIKELTPNGLVEVFELETEEISQDDDERMEAVFDTVTKMAMDSDSMFLQTNHGSIVIRGLSKKTIRFQPVWGSPDED